MSKLITSDQIAYQVFIALEEDQFLPVGEKISLEFLSSDCDGIFKNAKAWRSFVFGNFAEYCDPGEHWLEGDCKKSTVKKWCYPLAHYKNRFVAKIGRDKFVKVNAEDLEFKFTFDANWIRPGDKITSSVEIFVQADFKQ